MYSHDNRSGPGISVDWLRAGRSGDRIPVGARFFAHVHTGPEAHPSSCTVGPGSFPEIKRPGRGADHPPHPSAEVENEESYTSTPPSRTLVACTRWTLPLHDKWLYMIPCDSNKVLCIMHWVRLLEQACDLSPLYISPARIWSQSPFLATGTLVQFSPGVNQLESSCLLASICVKVKNKWRYTSTTQYVSMTFKGRYLPLLNKTGLGIYYN
jgi:hypothetical protein